MSWPGGQEYPGLHLPVQLMEPGWEGACGIGGSGPHRSDPLMWPDTPVALPPTCPPREAGYPLVEPRCLALEQQAAPKATKEGGWDHDLPWWQAEGWVNWGWHPGAPSPALTRVRTRGWQSELGQVRPRDAQMGLLSSSLQDRGLRSLEVSWGGGG